MRLPVILFFLVAFILSFDGVVADIVKPEHSLAPVAPPGYESQPVTLGSAGIVPLGPCSLAVPPGAIPEDGGTGEEDCVLNDFVDFVNNGCNGSGNTIPLQPGDVVTGHAFTYFGGPEIPDELTALGYRTASGSLYGTEGDTVYRFAPGQLPDSGVVIGDLAGFSPEGLTYDSMSDTFFAVAGNEWRSFQVLGGPGGETTGAISPATILPLVDPQALAGPNTDGHYVVCDAFSHHLFRITDASDPAGTVTDLGLIGGTGPGVTFHSLFFAPDPVFGGVEKLFGVGTDGNTYTISLSMPPFAQVRGAIGIPHGDVRGGAFDAIAGVAYIVDGKVNEIDRLSLQDGDAAGTRTQARDTDWFAIEPLPGPDPMTIRWTVATNVKDIPGQGALNLFVIQDLAPTCNGSTDIVASIIKVSGDCNERFVQFTAEPGEQYYLWVGTNGFAGYECDLGDPDSNRYYGRYELLPPTDSCVQFPVPPSLPSWGEDFDDYVLPQPQNGINLDLAPENDSLEPWDFNPTFPVIIVNDQFTGVSTPPAHSAANMMWLGGPNGDSDCVRRYCDVQQGNLVGRSFFTRVHIYVPQGSTGDAYYIEMSDYEPGGAKTWAHQSHFRDDGSVDEEIHGHASGVYDFDRWLEILVEHDLDNNLQRLRIDGAFLGTTGPFPWTDTPATGINVEASDYFSGGHSGYFYDTLGTFTQLAGVQGIRGDFNGDGSFQGIPDGVGLLMFSFVPGSPGPPCEETADADGNGAIAGLTDGLAILTTAFVPGAPPLPPPYPTCGVLTNLLSCSQPPVCP